MSVPIVRAVIAAVAMLISVLPGQAQITLFVVEHTESLGPDGPERLTGHVYGEVDPKLPLNAIITDLEFAPRNARGMVEYTSTFTMVRPADMANASGLLIWVASNRGRMDLTADGFFADARRQGHVLVTSGWQGDLEPTEGLETMSVPVARRPDGSSITGRVLARFGEMPPGTTTLPILRGGVAGTADPESLDSSKAILTRRTSEQSETVPLRNSDWAFADCSSSSFPGTPDPRMVCLKDGFDPAFLYELVYTAKDPKVYGLGFAATRDFTAFLRHGVADEAGTPNPLQGRISWAISQGNSQAGTFLRSFIHLGFNQDEAGRIVFDGINPERAARLLAMNIRFGAPSGGAAMYEAGSDGIVWWGEYTDQARQRPSGALLERCGATDTCPKIVETLGSAEFYHLRASPALVGTGADRDIPLPPNVRRYYSPGVRHGGGAGGFDPDPHTETCCGLTQNPNPTSDTLRALRTALVEWVVDGTLPPPSQYPRLDRGELASPTQAALGFPTIPGVPLPDGLLNPFYDYDFGPQFHYSDLSGVITMQPPPIRRVLPTLAPTVDVDGNEISGVASVLHQVPLGTYTGWNTVASGFYKGRLRNNAGAFIPFAKTKIDRDASGDPRLSLEERYGTHDAYVEEVRAAAVRLVRGRFLLQDDADRLIAEAEASTVLR